MGDDAPAGFAAWAHLEVMGHRGVRPVTRLAFVDCETTGLDPDLHEVWEVALILRSGGVDSERVWQLPVDLGRADPYALNIGGFAERRWPTAESPAQHDYSVAGYDPAVVTDTIANPQAVHPTRMHDWAAEFSFLTWGAHLVGAVVSFDEERLRRLLRRHGACPGWHYHLIDVEALAAGWLATEEATLQRPPWDSESISKLVGVDVDQFARHTAIGDARWAQAIHDRILGDRETDG